MDSMNYYLLECIILSNDCDFSKNSGAKCRFLNVTVRGMFECEYVMNGQ